MKPKEILAYIKDLILLVPGIKVTVGSATINPWTKTITIKDLSVSMMKDQD